jgi:hypothetical protein
MSNKKIIQGITLTFLFAFLGLFTTLKFFASQDSIYSYGRPSYYGQYGYGYNSGSSIYRAYNTYDNYAYNYRPYGPYLMPSVSYNPLYGYRQNYDSYIYVDNALDYTYYTNPQLLEPRYMNNHQWYARGLWPQGFYY